MTLIEFLRLPLEEKRKGIWLSGIYGEGECIRYWKNGQIYKHCFYKNGELHGEYKDWHPNGQLWECCYYEDGVFNGERKAWHNDGLLYRHCLYENGKIIKDYLK